MKKKINKKSCIYVTGHKGLVGSSVLRRLKYYGYKNILTATKGTLDLRDQKKLLKLHLENTKHCPAVNEVFNHITNKFGVK